MGLVSSLIGLGLGVLAAIGLEKLLSGFGVTLPSGPLVFEARTVIVCLVVGVGVTLVSAISPARRAVRIAPVAAVSAQQTEEEVPLRRRFTRGGIITVVGVALLGLGADRAGHRAGRPRCRPHLRRRGHAGPRRGPADGERHRPPPGPPARRLGPARPGELHAQPPADGADVVGPDGRARPRLGHRRVRRLPVALGHRQRGQRHQRRPHRLDTSNGGNGNFSESVPQAASSVPGVTASTTVYGDQFEFRSSLESLLAIGTKNMSQTVILSTTSGSGARRSPPATCSSTRRRPTRTTSRWARASR